MLLKGGKPGEPGGPPGESTRPGEPGGLGGVTGGSSVPDAFGSDPLTGYLNEATQSDARLNILNARLGRAKLATKRASEDVAWASRAVFIGPSPGIDPEMIEATSGALRPQLGMPPGMDMDLGGSPEATKAAQSSS